MAETTRIIPTPGQAAVVEPAARHLPAHVWFWALAIVATLAIVALAVRAAVKARAGERAQRALGTLFDFSLYFGIPVLAVASWVYRPLINEAINGVLFFLGALSYWIQDLTPIQRVGYVFLLAIFVYEMRLYVKFARFVWRRINNDLCRRAGESGELNMIGRLYGVEEMRAATGEPTFRLYFVPHDAGLFDFLWAKHTLDVPERPVPVGKCKVAISAMGIERDMEQQRHWRLRQSLQDGHPFGGKSSTALMESSLEDNKLVVQHGIDGNPHVLAARATRNSTTHVSTRSLRKHAPRTIRPTGPDGAADAVAKRGTNGGIHGR